MSFSQWVTARLQNCPISGGWAAQLLSPLRQDQHRAPDGHPGASSSAPLPEAKVQGMFRAAHWGSRELPSLSLGAPDQTCSCLLQVRQPCDLAISLLCGHSCSGLWSLFVRQPPCPLGLTGQKAEVLGALSRSSILPWLASALSPSQLLAPSASPTRARLRLDCPPRAAS